MADDELVHALNITRVQNTLSDLRQEISTVPAYAGHPLVRDAFAVASARMVQAHGRIDATLLHRETSELLREACDPVSHISRPDTDRGTPRDGDVFMSSTRGDFSWTSALWESAEAHLSRK